MHVFVTGAAGFIGSHTCEQLVQRGHRVTGFDNFDELLYAATLKRRNAEALAKLPTARFNLVEGDIRDPAAVDQALGADVDVVCHLAALAGVRPSLQAPLRYLRTNIEGTGVICERMRQLGIRRLVFASSSSVYGVRASTEPFREDEPCLAPASPYAATKRMNEIQLSTYRDLYGVGVFLLRYFTVYGPRQRSDMAIAKFTSAIARGAPIQMFGDGSSRRDYTFIDDIVAGTTAAVERVRPGDYEILNLGGNHTVSLRDLIAKIETTVGRSAVIVTQPEQPGDVPLTSANIERAAGLLNYAPMTTLDDGLRRYWQWCQTLSE